MKKFSKVKRIFTILLIFLFSINSFATSVGDNDGAAFITKAEFDSLKNNFQSQIDSYNQGIDSKIDGAIASYLAGVSVANDINNPLFFPIDNIAATGNYKKYVFVEKDHQEQKTQIFNNITWSFDYFGYNYGVKQLKPYIWNQTSTGPFNGTHWGLSSRALNSPYIKHATTDVGFTIQPQLEGFVFDASDDKFVLTNWFLNNNLNISGQSVMTGNPNGYRRGDSMFPVQPTVFDGQKINQNFTPGNKLNMPYGFLGFSSGDTDDSTFVKSFPRAGGITLVDSEINKWWPAHLDKMTTTTEIPGFKWENRGSSYDPTIQRSTCFITETRANEDSNIYLYNVCDCNIYAHDTNEVNVERLVDFLPTSKRPLTSDCVQCIWDNGKQMQTLYGDDKASGGPDDAFLGAVGYGMAFPKIKLKNSYITHQSNGFDNLAWFKNGYLKFSIDGSAKYPDFYGGLPLYTEKGNTDPDTVKLTIRLDPTVDTSVSGFWVWIKADGFKNADVGLAPYWTTTDMNNLKVLECAGCTYDSTSKCLFIPKGVKKEITIKGVKQGETLYLRCCEDGNYYGGEIKYLGDCVSHYES